MQLVKYISSSGLQIDFSLCDPFVLQSIQGANVDAVHRSNSNYYTHGGLRTKTTFEKRYLKLKGAITCQNRKQYTENKRVLENVFNPLLNDGKLIMDSGDGERYLNAIAEETPLITEYKGNYAFFTIEMVTHDPFWHDMDYEEFSFTTPFTSLFSFPISFQNSSFQMGVTTTKRIFNNVGNVPTPLVIEFEGGISNVKLFNKTNGESIEFKKRLNSNEILFINSRNGEKEVTIINSNGDRKNGFDFIDLNEASFNTYMHLETGQNELEFIADTEKSLAKVKLKWLTNYLGA